VTGKKPAGWTEEVATRTNHCKVLKDKVRRCHHKDFFICEDDQWLLQGWMGRILFAQSTWVAEGASLG